MRARFINEDNKFEFFKNKPQEKIIELLKDKSFEELMSLGHKNYNIEVIHYALKNKCKTKIFSTDWHTIDRLNPINLFSFWILNGYDDHYAYIKRLANGQEENCSILFFAERFRPIYKSDEEITSQLKIVEKTSRKILNILNKQNES